MILADTSIWIEFLKNHNPYYTTLRNMLENQNVLTLECVFGELLQGAKNIHETKIITSYWNNLPKPPQPLLAKAGLLPVADGIRKHLNPLDKILPKF